MNTEEKFRATGRTTRLVDYYIQELFNNGEIKVYDHWETKEGDRELILRIKKRMDNEHPSTKI
jgi:hypothetical protein